MLAKPEEIPALPGAHETIKMIAGHPWTIGTLLEFEKQRDAEGSKARSSRPPCPRVVMNCGNALYPVQLRSDTEECRAWAKHRFVN